METPEESIRMILKGENHEILGTTVQGLNHVSLPFSTYCTFSHVFSDPQRSGQPGLSSAGRDKFEPINSPYMPLALESWQRALRIVNCSKEELFSTTKLTDNDGKYAFPEPGIFCSGDNRSRQNHFLTIWSVIRDICIYRLASNASSVQLLSNQDWRTLLSG